MRFSWLLLVLGCGDVGDDSGGGGTTTLPTGRCREVADCVEGHCFSPGEPNCPVLQSCYGAGLCATGQSCLEADPAFESCADSVCRDDCATDGDCRAGVETCDLTTAHCTPIACDAGFTCATHETCTPGGSLHGCLRDACTTDADCGDGSCVNGACFSELGTCGMLAEN